jgi:TrmH family RNA methyltransferase
VKTARFFVPGEETADKKKRVTEAPMIESPHNEKLKLVRKLRERKQRQREELFATEGEDLIDAGLAAGAEPRFVLIAAGSGLPTGEGAEEVEPELLAATSSLGSGTRAIAVWPLRWAERPQPPCIYLHGVADPGNVGTIIRTAAALLGGSVVLGPDCADPFSPKAVRASMGSVFSQPLLRADIDATPGPRVALVAHGGEGLEGLDGAATLCLGAEREGLPNDVLGECDATVTIPLREGAAESLNVAAAAAIACQRLGAAAGPGGASAAQGISSPTMTEGQPDA